jgi:rare lipoprotein A
MDTSLGNVRTATLSGRLRSACIIAAMVSLPVFAKDAVLPAFAAHQAATNIKYEAAPEAPAPPIKTFTRIKSGLASWYGKVLQGHLTASGRRFNMDELTAAHRTLPFGSQVKVTDLRNNRSVVVTVTDRGVLNEDRVIDLSLGAARELQMVRMGVDPVRLELISYHN